VPDDHPRGERAHPAADAPIAQPCRNLSLSTRRAASRRVSNGQDDGTEWEAACISYPLARTIAAWKQAIGKGSIEKAHEDLDVDTAEPLANVLCLLVAPSPADMLKEHRRATEALRECVEKLERRAR